MLDVKTSARFGSMWACCRLTEDLRIPILQGLSAENERHDPPYALAERRLRNRALDGERQIGHPGRLDLLE